MPRQTVFHRDKAISSLSSFVSGLFQASKGVSKVGVGAKLPLKFDMLQKLRYLRKRRLIVFVYFLLVNLSTL